MPWDIPRVGFHWQAKARAAAIRPVPWRRMQAGKADDVADGKDVGHVGAKIFVHLDSPTVIRFDTGRRQVQAIDVPLPADRIKQRVAYDPFVAAETAATSRLVTLPRFRLLRSGAWSRGGRACGNSAPPPFRHRQIPEAGRFPR